MARSDVLINLVRAFNHGDKTLIRRTLEALIAEERKKQHHVLADRLSELLKSNGFSESKSLTIPDERVQSLFYEIIPQRKIQDLLLPNIVTRACEELIEEHQRRDLLHSFNLEPRHRLLLVGPPGNGKTSLAEALAYLLMMPLYIVRYEGIIGSYLGETAVRLRRLFDYVRTRHCVLFFDEFDTIGKERGDIHETGEIKRVVSSLLLQMDLLPSHVIVITATNHPELLDRAVWRRFQLKLSLPNPDRIQLLEYLRRLEERLGENLGHSLESLSIKLEGASFAELEEFETDILRRRVLDLPDGDLKKIVSERLKQWQERFTQSDLQG